MIYLGVQDTIEVLDKVHDDLDHHEKKPKDVDKVLNQFLRAKKWMRDKMWDSSSLVKNQIRIQIFVGALTKIDHLETKELIEILCFLAKEEDENPEFTVR